MPWFTPTCDSQMKVMPTVTVQKVLRLRGFGSMLEQSEQWQHKPAAWPRKSTASIFTMDE
jgi:hypothetical protein